MDPLATVEGPPVNLAREDPAPASLGRLIHRAERNRNHGQEIEGLGPKNGASNVTHRGVCSLIGAAFQRVSLLTNWASWPLLENGADLERRQGSQGGHRI
ncbi:predicted protein [Histoplasma capsulatum G186AR]|uniref:Uncharacterized protein n=1 Tax=Ajellomyces capsulatus (strain G186AR / H82 / ATCC MYA-2454 / RMSCC 2432) TaxID=447093 RepID=C0NU56_AJECG|nr:uncharacterized protein HCBG_06887 [Histoplasma capsulatum G186AR]EEH04936.1 predicted protein [Histoplasma capsulatum G186AR]